MSMREDRYGEIGSPSQRMARANALAEESYAWAAVEEALAVWARIVTDNNLRRSGQDIPLALEIIRDVRADAVDRE